MAQFLIISYMLIAILVMRLNPIWVIPIGIFALAITK